MLRLEPKGRKKPVSQFQGRQTGEFSLTEGHSALCSIQPFSWMDKAHPQEGEQFALLSLSICVDQTHKHPLRHTQNHV